MTYCSNLQNPLIANVNSYFHIQTITDDYVTLSRDLKKMQSMLLSMYDTKVARWLQAMDLSDKEVTAHTLRVTAVSLDLGRMMGLTHQELQNIQFGTLLHDIGKLGIPDAIIKKPGKLSADEYQIVQKHTIYGHQWISSYEKFQSAKDIPLYHHEWWDGNGYPHHLKGKDIPLLARIVAVADVWDAVTSDRPYRRAMSKAQAINLIESESRSHFDPDIVKVFMKLGVLNNRTEPYSHALIG